MVVLSPPGMTTQDTWSSSSGRRTVMTLPLMPARVQGACSASDMLRSGSLDGDDTSLHAALLEAGGGQEAFASAGSRSSPRWSSMTLLFGAKATEPASTSSITGGRMRSFSRAP